MVSETFIALLQDEMFINGIEESIEKILIINGAPDEDDQLIIRLENDGFHTKQVSSVSQALEACKESYYDFVIAECDNDLEATLSFCKTYTNKKYLHNVPFIMVSSKRDDLLAAECLRNGAEDFLIRPMESEVVSLKIKRILEMKAPAEKQERAGVHGKLSHISFADLLQILSTGQKSVRISLDAANGESGEVFMEAGEVVHATSGNLEGEQAFYHMAKWAEGDFEVLPCSEFTKRSINASVMGLLLEGSRLEDEQTT
jgi:DNA-binding response OmpR family regulator